MNENLHRKLADKLRQEHDYPDFRHEDWLVLDDRLEKFDSRRRRWGWLWFALPFVLLAGMNVFLLLRNTENSVASASVEKRQTTVLFDTLVKKVIVYEYDTIYRKTYVTEPASYFPSFFDQKNNTAGSRGEVSEGWLPSVSAEDSMEMAGRGILSGEFRSLENRPDPDALPYPGLDELVFHKKKKKLVTETAELKTKLRRKPLLYEARTGVSGGVTLPQTAGANALPGLRFAWDNEFALGQRRLVLWQSIAWQQMLLQSRDHKAIPGFPLPDKPTQESHLDKVEFSKQELTVQLGLAWQFNSVKNFRPVLGFGIGGNYRLSAEQTGLFEHDGGEEYVRVTMPFSTGWGGLSAHARLGLGWQFHRLWEMRLDASFNQMLNQPLPDGNIGRWWGMDATVFYRWR